MKSRKFLVFVAVAVFTLAMALAFTGCSSSPATLEDYINSDTSAQESIESTAESTGMEITVEGNTVTFTYTYDGDLSGYEDTISTYLEEYMNTMTDTFTTLTQELEEKSGISGCTIKIVFLDSSGAELYSNEYSA